MLAKSDKTGRRGLVVLFGVLCQWMFSVTFRALPDTASAGLKFGILTMSTATCSWWRKSIPYQTVHLTRESCGRASVYVALTVNALSDSVNGSWLSINASCPEKRAVRMVRQCFLCSSCKVRLMDFYMLGPVHYGSELRWDHWWPAVPVG